MNQENKIFIDAVEMNNIRYRRKPNQESKVCEAYMQVAEDYLLGFSEKSKCDWRMLE